jgi:hypothetical protein
VKPKPTAALAPVQAEYETVAEAAATAAAKPAKPSREGGTARDMLKSRKTLQQGILLAEILGKPVALRDE